MERFLDSVGYIFFPTGATDKLRYANYALPTFCRKRWRPLLVASVMQHFSSTYGIIQLQKLGMYLENNGFVNIYSRVEITAIK